MEASTAGVLLEREANERREGDTILQKQINTLTTEQAVDRNNVEHLSERFDSVEEKVGSMTKVLIGAAVTFALSAITFAITTLAVYGGGHP